MLKRIFFGLFAFALRRLRLLPDAESSSWRALLPRTVVMTAGSDLYEYVDVTS